MDLNMRNQGFESLECVLTTACNLSCSYCHQGQHQSEYNSWERLKNGIDRLAGSTSGMRKLGFTGGEPLLAWPLIQNAVEYLTQTSAGMRDIKVSLTTNGLLLDEEKLAFLITHDIKVQLSFDGIREAQELRAPGSYDQLDRLLFGIKRKYPRWMRKRLSIGMLLSSAHLPYLSRSAQYFLDRGVETILLAPLLTHDDGWGAEAEAELESQAQALFDLCREHFDRSGTIPFEVFLHGVNRPAPEPNRPVCRVHSSGATALGVDGSYAPCILLLDPEAGGTRRGNGLKEWIKRPDWPGLRRERFSSFGNCRDCEFVDECLVCPVASAHIPGNRDFRRVPELNCAFNRVFGALRRDFPPWADDRDRLRGRDPLPAAMLELAEAVGHRVSRVGEGR